MSEPIASRSTVMSAEAFAALGGSTVAYIRPIRSEDVPFIYPDAPELEAGLALFAKHCRGSGCELRVQSGTRIIELLVAFDSEVRYGASRKVGRTSESGH